MKGIGMLRRRSRRGSAFVEGALVLAVVIFTLIGIVDIGQVLVLHQGLTERVRAGARYAVVTPWDGGAITRIKNVAMYNTDAPAEDSKPLLGLTSSMITVQLLDPGTPEARIEVTVVNYPFRFFTPLIKGVYSARPIKASMPVEGQGATS
jgi:hypothetical protein